MEPYYSIVRRTNRKTWRRSTVASTSGKQVSVSRSRQPPTLCTKRVEPRSSNSFSLASRKPSTKFLLPVRKPSPILSAQWQLHAQQVHVTVANVLLQATHKLRPISGSPSSLRRRIVTHFRSSPLSLTSSARTTQSATVFRTTTSCSTTHASLWLRSLCK